MGTDAAPHRLALAVSYTEQAECLDRLCARLRAIPGPTDTAARLILNASSQAIALRTRARELCEQVLDAAPPGAGGV